MRLLKLRVNGAHLFENDGFELDFIATDRVPRDEEGNIPDVTPLPKGSSIYTQNIMGLVGVNASGKTTVLNIVRMVLGYMSESYVMRRFAVDGNFLGDLGEQITISCVFYEEGNFYLIDSDLVRVAGVDGDYAQDGASLTESFSFENECLWICPSNRVSRKLVVDIDQFRAASELFVKRNGDPDDDTVLDAAARTFLDANASIVSIVTGKKPLAVECTNRALPLSSLPTPVVQAFDPSIEYLNWNHDNQVFHLKFKNELSERIVSASVAKSILSNGTIMGAELVDRAIAALKRGGYLIVDEMETGLNRSLVATVVELFASPVTNPLGATLLFSTHYSELLDSVQRKDNVYVLVRGDSFRTSVIKYSNRIGRIENKKSDVILNNVIKGSMPKYPDVQAMRDYVRRCVNE